MDSPTTSTGSEVTHAGFVETVAVDSKSGVDVACEDDMIDEDHYHFGSVCRVGKRRCWLFLVLGVVVIAGSLVATVLTTTKGDSIESSAQSKHPNHSDAYYKERFSVFRPAVGKVSASTDLIQPDTPQSQALDWMIYQDSTIQHQSFDERHFYQRYAMLVLFYACGGEEWQNFPNGSIEGQSDVATCQWQGNDFIKCDDENNVLHLDLSARGLIGQLPTELGLLSALETMHLNQNLIGGTLSSALFEGLTRLTSVQIYNNDISGPIPSSIGRLTDLRTLDLNANALTSSLPSELAGLSKLETLNVMKNIELSGPFFEPFGMAWPNLRHLVLDETLLNGTIAPDAVARWNNSLETLSIRDTMIAGIIPSAIQELHKLKSLNLVGPAFQGSFPALTHLLQLQELSLSSSKITGSIPSEIGLLTNLRKLLLVNLNITGTIPTDLGACTLLEQLVLGFTLLSGTIPEEIGTLPLEALSVVMNPHLSGTIPCFDRSYIPIEYSCTLECTCCGKSGCV